MRTKLKTIFSFIALQTLVLICLSAPAYALPVPAGDAIVVDPDAGTNGLGALFIVDLFPANFGNRTLVSDFGNTAQGPLGGAPSGVALESFVDAIVADEDGGTGGLGALFRVNLRTGNRIMISDFGDPIQGPLGDDPLDLVLDGLGNAIVIDEDAGTGIDGGLFSVDLITGDRILVSDFGDPAQGPLGDDPGGVTLDDAGNALVIDLDAGTDGRGGLFSVDLITGDRILVSDFGDPAQGLIGSEPDGVTLDGLGNALVVDRVGVTDTFGALFRVNLTPGPTSGDRTLISDFGDPAKGPLGEGPKDVTLAGLENALVIDEEAGSNLDGALFSVVLATGDRTLISNFGDPAQGPLGVDPEGVAFRPGPSARPIPTLSEWGLIATAAVLGLAGLYAARRRKAAA